MSDSPAGPRPLPLFATLHERLRYLLAEHDVPADRNPTRYAADWIRDYANNDPTGQTEALTHTYLDHLLSGVQDNPSIKKIRGIARFFNVPPAYLLVDARPDAQDEPPAVTVLTARARGLGSRDLRVVSKLVESLLRDDGDAPAQD